MRAVDIAYAGFMTIVREKQTAVFVTWPGHISANQWCGLSANLRNFDLFATESVVVINQGSHHDGQRDVYSAFAVLEGFTDREGVVQLNLIVMTAADPTFPESKRSRKNENPSLVR